MVTHESLLRVWPRAKKWILENERFLKSRAQLLADFHAWNRAGKRKEFLLPKGCRLKAARKFAREAKTVISKEEGRFVLASVRKARFSSAGHWIWNSLGMAALSAGLVAAVIAGAFFCFLMLLGDLGDYVLAAMPTYVHFGWKHSRNTFQDEDLDTLLSVMETGAAIKVPDGAILEKVNFALADWLVDALLKLGRTLPSQSGVWSYLESDAAFGRFRVAQGKSNECTADACGDFCELALQSGNFEVADRAFQKMLKWAPEVLKREDDAERLTHKLLSVSRRLIINKTGRGDGDGSWEIAQQTLKVLHKDPQDTSALYDLAELSLLCARLEEAAVAIDKALLTKPEDLHFLVCSLCVRAEMGQTDAAKRLTEQIAGSPQFSCDVMGLLAYDAAKNGWKTAARILIELVDAKCPGTSIKGWSLIHLGDYRMALDLFNQSETLDSSEEGGSEENLTGQIICQWLLGEKVEAKHLYRRLISLDPTWAGPGALNARELPLAEILPLEAVRKVVGEEASR